MRLICKKCLVIPNENGTSWLTVGQHYDLKEGIFTYTLEDKGIIMLHFWKTTKQYSMYSQPYIWDHFYTLKEERKLKLQKLETAL